MTLVPREPAVVKKALDVVVLFPKSRVTDLQHVFVVLGLELGVENGEHLVPGLLVESVAGPVASVEVVEH